MLHMIRLSLLMALFTAASSSLATTPPPRHAQGTIGDLSWEVLFTMPVCDHADEPSSFCTRADDSQANEAAGVLDRMIAIIKNPRFRHVYLASYSLSNKVVVDALCGEAKTRGLKVHVYVDKSTFRYSDATAELRKCSPNVKVLARGTGFGSGENSYIQHAKMMLATEHEEFLPLHDLAGRRPADEAARLGDAKTTFISTSANLSSVGFGLDFENWIFFETPFKHRLAQQNVCFFYAMDRMTVGSDPIAERDSFANRYLECQNTIAAPVFDAIEFYPVPHASLFQKAYAALRTMIDEAKSSIKVGVHRLSTASLSKPLMSRSTEGVQVTALFDDDTLRSGKCQGGVTMDVGANTVATYRTIHDAGIDVRLMRTNGGVPHMYHDKFVIADDSLVFVGAGNFTSASLNVHGVGNFEQFYLFRDATMAKAYVTAWNYYLTIATLDENHPVYSHTDRGLVPAPETDRPGLLVYDDASCGT